MSKPNLIPPVVTEQLLNRFWGNVDKTPGHGPRGECWLWTGSAFKFSGYGRIKHLRRSYRAHRLAYFLIHSRWPSNLACHRCDIPLCVNPVHLFDGTSKDNSLDAKQKGRLPSGENHWSRFHPERIARGDQNGSRVHRERMPRGSGHKRAKLNDNAVREIRLRYANDGLTLMELATRYGVTISTVNKAILRRTWAHIE